MERWLRIVRLRLRTLFRRGQVESELEEEIRYHVDRQTEENLRSGMTGEEARRSALLAFGGEDYQKERVRDARGLRWLEDTGRDLQQGLRALGRQPGFSAAVVLTLALGIGANTAMFTVLRGTLLRSLPHRNGEQLVYLRQSAEGLGSANVLFSVPEIRDYRESTQTLSQIAEYSSMTFTLVGSDGEPMHVRTGIISGNYFDVMGLEAIAGRVTSAGDDGPSAGPVTVLSYPFWMSHYGGDRSVVGRPMRINDRESTIIGVLQPAPLYPQKTDVFVNMVTSPHHLSATMVTDRIHRMTEVFARLGPGATVEQARSDIGRVASEVYGNHPDAYDGASRFAVSVLPLREALNERAALTFWLLMGSAVFVLLIACANVANLTLMRGVGREREVVVRTALGAGRWRLLRLQLVENLALALFGGVLGVLVAYSGLRMLVAFAAQLTPRADEIRMDGVVLIVSLLTSVTAAIVLSFVSGSARSRPELVLAGGDRRSTGGRGRRRFQHLLVVAQLAVCMVLLTGAGLLVRTLLKLQAVDTGVRADHALTVELPIEGSFENFALRQAENLAAYERMRERAAALPGVEVVSLASGVPLRGTLLSLDVKAEGRPPVADEPVPHAVLRAVDGDYLAAAGIPLLAGRSFTTTDRRGSAPVVLLSRRLAQQLFGDADPVGRRMAWTGEILKFTPISGEWRTIVGVVGDTRDEGIDSEPTPTVYEPFGQAPVLGGALIVRTTSDPAAIQPAILRTVREVSPRQLIERPATLEQIRDAAVAPRRLNTLFIASFGTLALIIAMVGIAGVLAFSVRARTAEIGIRMSLGADPGRVHRMVLGEGAGLLGAGVAVGLTGALGATRLLRGLLFGVTPHDPSTLVAVGLVLTVVGVAACWLPAVRAARIQPAVALRAE